jgi:hypothetical protein
MLKPRHLFIFAFSVLLSIMVGAAFADAPKSAQFIHFTVHISATNGEPAGYETEGPMAGEKCLKILEGMGGRQVKNGLAEVHFCRAVDAQGAPVPEIKINPDTMRPLDESGKAPVARDEKPKVST